MCGMRGSVSCGFSSWPQWHVPVLSLAYWFRVRGDRQGTYADKSVLFCPLSKTTRDDIEINFLVISCKTTHFFVYVSMSNRIDDDMFKLLIHRH